MTIDYEKIQSSINEYGKYILGCIKSQYNKSLTNEQLEMIDRLSNEQFIVIEKLSDKDIEFFSKQEGINNPSEFSADYIPSAHGGRTKFDNKIHIYPFTKTFNDCNSNDDIVKLCIDDIVVHEIFHYFIRPNLSNENNDMRNEFGHFLTEGLVQYYSEIFAEKYRLGNPKSNYGKNVEFAKEIISGFDSSLTQTQIDNIVFTNNQDEILTKSKYGKLLYEKFIIDDNFSKEIENYIVNIGNEIGLTKGDKKLRDIIKHYKKITNLDTLESELSSNINMIFANNQERESELLGILKKITSSKKLADEMFKYKKRMLTYLPIENKVSKLKSQNLSSTEIALALDEENQIFNSIPSTLYHGSQENLDVINSRESTQKGSYVYATDNPIHALFFSIFRNSSVARAHINEYINENGEYKAMYEIDERISGALDEIITDRDITIHLCNGEQFSKPEGEAYISREWISKEGQSIIPTDKIQINVKSFFENLEKQGLVEYSRYTKSKDWKTVLDLLGQNYPFGLGTEFGKNIENFDALYDNFIEKNFPEQLEFSKAFRSIIKSILASDLITDMTKEEQYNYKLSYIREYAQSFLNKSKDANGKIIYNIDIDKIQNFTGQSEEIVEEMGRSL